MAIRTGRQDEDQADGWLPRQSYGELRNKGVEILKKYADLVQFDDQELLATEFSFCVPIQGTWDKFSVTPSSNCSRRRRSRSFCRARRDWSRWQVRQRRRRRPAASSLGMVFCSS